ncbi:MAG: hypothetical protein DDT22_00664 [candidate division WS2 bacterium]|nr:hypothetical protein [Candidatus Lithacetigena glycinireducens]MBT9174990.1 hypothetical protein [Candidatus Lithacetigena glycinireducens]
MIFDFIISAWLIYLFYSGYKRGLIKQLSAVLAIFISWYIALAHTDTFITLLESRLSLLSRITASMERFFLRQNPALFGMRISEEGIKEFINTLPFSQSIKEIIIGGVSDLTASLTPLILASVLGRLLGLILLGIISFLSLFFLTRWLLNFTTTIITKLLKSLQPVGFINFALGGVLNLLLYGLLMVFLSGFVEALLHQMFPGFISLQLEKSILFGYIRFLSEQGLIEKMVIFLYYQLLNLLK